MSEIVKSTADSPADRSLYLAFELGNSEWKLGFSIGLGQAARQRKVQAGDRVVAAPVSGQPGGGKPGGGLGQYRGEPPGQTGQDGSVGCAKTADDADPL